MTLLEQHFDMALETTDGIQKLWELILIQDQMDTGHRSLKQ